MNKFIKIVSIIMVLIIASLSCSCGSLSVPKKIDYFNSGKQFDFFTYKSISNGTYKVFNGIEDESIYVGRSFIDKESIKDYFDSGMKLISPQVVASANSEKREFETSDLKKVMDICHELGHDKSVVLTDNQLYAPYWGAVEACEENGAYYGYTSDDYKKITCIKSPKQFEWQFESEEELDSFVETQLRQYYSHPAFNGVFLPDEPQAKYLNLIGEVFRSVRRVEVKLKKEFNKTEDMYININLFPYYNSNVAFPSVEEGFSGDEMERKHEGYRRYIQRYFEETKADSVQADIYPMGKDKIDSLYVINLQIMAEVAKEYNAKIIVITQANNDQNHRQASYESLNYLNNITMGFGAKNIGYYAYYTLDDSTAGDTKYVYDENGCMVNRYGDKTNVYYVVKSLNEQAQKLAPVVLNFDYSTSNTYINFRNKNSNSLHMETAHYYEGIQKKEFTKLKSVEIDREMAVVTELYDADRGNYMYMFMNTTDPLNKSSVYYQTTTASFAEGCKNALIYFNGEYTKYKLDKNNSLTLKMKPGEAQYVIPY